MQDDQMIQSLTPLEITLRDGEEIVLSKGRSNLPEKKLMLPGFEAVHACGPYGKMEFFHLAGQDFDIWYSNYSVRKHSTFLACGNFPVLELHASLQSDITSWWDDWKQNVQHDQQFEISYIPFINNRTEFGQGKYYSTFDIHFKPSFLRNFCPQAPALSRFLDKVDKGLCANLFEAPQFLSPRMLTLVWAMLNCNVTPAFAERYFENCVQLYLIEVLDRSNSLGSPISQSSPYDIDLAIAAKEIILGDLSEKYSIESLAKATGSNQWILQRSFKQHFGSTIFEYSQSARLELAKLQLLETNKPIQEIASQCGYHDHSNLTAAFRQKFGVSPAKYRKNFK
ncbi:MAG TPA: AraC family transcriptional regulator [Puia sp.]|nr:AraC family transcriptional regulator [Puia sp.]